MADQKNPRAGETPRALETPRAGEAPRALEEMRSAEDARLFSPSTARNKDPLLQALVDVIAQDASVLEIASGTGEHAVCFCTALPGLRWQPSDIAGDALVSIAAWREATRLGNLAAPLTLDVTGDKWWGQIKASFDVVFSCNMLHITPWAAACGLIKGAGAVLGEGGMLILYGPFSKGGVHSAVSNAEFDRSLKARNVDWGVRDINDISEHCGKVGLNLEREIEMPANNRVLLYRKAAP